MKCAWCGCFEKQLKYGYVCNNFKCKKNEKVKNERNNYPEMQTT